MYTLRILLCWSISTLVLAQDDVGPDSSGTATLARQAIVDQGARGLDDNEIKDLAPVARAEEDVEKADLGVVPSEANQMGSGGALGTIMNNQVNAVISPSGKPYAGDLSRKKVQELLRKMYIAQQLNSALVPSQPSLASKKPKLTKTQTEQSSILLIQH